MLRHWRETLNEATLREAKAAGGIADVAPLSGQPEELLAGPRYARAALGAVIGLVAAWVALAVAPPLGVQVLLLLVALPPAIYFVVPSLRFRIALAPDGIHRRVLMKDRVLAWSDVLDAWVTVKHDELGEGLRFLSEYKYADGTTPDDLYWALVVRTAGSGSVVIATEWWKSWPSTSRCWVPDERQRVMAARINEWAEIYRSKPSPSAHPPRPTSPGG